MNLKKILSTIILSILLCSYADTHSAPSNAQNKGDNEKIYSTVWSTAWSPNGQFLAVSGFLGGEYGYQVYDTHLDLISTFRESNNIVSNAWNPDGVRLAQLMGSSPDKLRIMNALEGNVLFEVDQPYGTGTYKLQWDSSGQYLAATRGFLQIYDTYTATQSAKVTTEKFDLRTVSEFSWIPQTLKMVVSAENTIYIWDVSSNIMLEERQFNDSIVSFAIDPKGTLLAVGDASGNVTILDLSRISETVVEFQALFDAPWKLVWSPQGDEIAIGGLNSDIAIWNVSSGNNVKIIVKASYGYLLALEYSPYGGRLLYTTNPLSIGATPIDAQSLNTSAFSSSILDGALQIIVPIATVERFAEIAASCNAPASLTQMDSTLQTDTLQAQTLLTQLDALPEGAIPVGCEADLRAIAEAMQAKGE